MSAPLFLPAIVTKIGTTRDKSIKIELETQDKATISAEDKAKILDLLDEYCTVGFKPMAPEATDPESIDLPDFVPEFKGDKTPSQRLRGVLYVLWEQTKKKAQLSGKPLTEDSDQFYRRQMERMIDAVKAKLDR